MSMHVPPALFASLVLLMAAAIKSLGRWVLVAGTQQTLSNLFLTLISMVETREQSKQEQQ